MFPLLEIIGVTYTNMTFLVGFTFLESGKKDNVIWPLEVCQTKLKYQENMRNVTIIDHDTTMINSVVNVFPTSYALLCRHHIIKKHER